jgi:hypothetical protein
MTRLRTSHLLSIIRLFNLFGPKREEVAGGWRRIHNDELHNFYASPNIRVIKSKKKKIIGGAYSTQNFGRKI